MCGGGSLPVLLRGREGWLKARWRSVFEGLWEFRAVHPPLLPPQCVGRLERGLAGRWDSAGTRSPRWPGRGKSGLVRSHCAAGRRLVGRAKLWEVEPWAAGSGACVQPGRALLGERPDGNPAAAPRSEPGGTWGAVALPGPAGSGAPRYLRARRGPRAGWGYRADPDPAGPLKGARAGHGDVAPRRGPTSLMPDPAFLPQGSQRGLRSAPFFSPGVWVP